jgi:phosphatidylserine/phosphatidylglycerophosphate/cardiolipin synthase-like enzyme
MKAVVIDGVDAFIGGIDLAGGRYDDDRHLLSDPDARTWAGGDYSNPYPSTSTHASHKFVDGSGFLLFCFFFLSKKKLIFLTGNPKKNPPPFFFARHHGATTRAVAAAASITAQSFHLDALDRRVFPRLPWHDVQARVSGAAASDAANAFVQIWNHNVEDPVTASSSPVRKTTAAAAAAAAAGAGGQPLSQPLSPLANQRGGSSSDGDYSDGDGVGFGAYRHLHPGGRWAQPPQRARASSAARSSQSSARRDSVSYGGSDDDGDTASSIPSGSWSVDDPDVDGPLGRRCVTSVCVLRSVGTWCGSRRTDDSIYSATVDLIENAKRFVYIGGCKNNWNRCVLVFFFFFFFCRAKI